MGPIFLITSAIKATAVLICSGYCSQKGQLGRVDDGTDKKQSWYGTPGLVPGIGRYLSLDNNTALYTSDYLSFMI